jgi:murein DD-endopeptidase MepM/ murein hydrolase activator NlpD
MALGAHSSVSEHRADRPIYNVARGTVVEAVDGLPENVPHSGKPAYKINLLNAGGNHVIVKIAEHRYVLYAHMRPGTVRVKRGDSVVVGQVLGHVGNSGNSTEPHLHLHIVDRPEQLHSTECHLGRRSARAALEPSATA